MPLLCSAFDFVLEGLRSVEKVEKGVEELAVMVEKKREETMVARDEKEEEKKKIRSSKQGREKQEYQMNCEIFIQEYRSAVKFNSRKYDKTDLFY